MKKHVLITGGAGFLGSHLCDLLLSKGYLVTAVDNLVTSSRKNIEHLLGRSDFQFIERDVTDAALWSEQGLKEFKFLTQHGLYGLLHFACPASPIDFERIPMEILAVDSIGTIFTVQLALKYRARYLVASTSEIYGDPLEHPQKETYWGNVNTLGPRACYDETKRFAEAYVSSAARWKGLNGGMVRIFNTYGPRMRPDDGRVVPELCIQALKGKPLTVHGKGLQTRSFCYVSDLVDGIVRLFESNIQDPVNIGNPVERTIMDFAQVVNRITHTQLPIEHLPDRLDDPRKRCPDITRARTLLGWEPKVSLDEGLAKTIEYFRAGLKSTV